MSVIINSIKKHQNQFLEDVIRTTYAPCCEDKLDFDIFLNKYYPKEESKNESI